MSLPSVKSHWHRMLILFCAALMLFLLYASWKHFYPVSSAKGWDVQVYQDDIPMVSALALDDNGGLFISQELSKGRGKILHRKADGSLSEALSGLSKPDGQVMFRGGLVTGQEGGKQPVVWLRDGKPTALFNADGSEGIATDGQVLYVIEDAKPGRLLRFTPDSGELEVLREGLQEGEGVSLCADGRLLYTEKTRGWVKQWQASGEDTLVVNGLNAPGFVLCSAEGLWITEDTTHMSRLLLLAPDGKLQVILEHLRSPQTIISLGDGSYLLAEQGRQRILQLHRQPDGL